MRAVSEQSGTRFSVRTETPQVLVGWIATVGYCLNWSGNALYIERLTGRPGKVVLRSLGRTRRMRRSPTLAVCFCFALTANEVVADTPHPVTNPGSELMLNLPNTGTAWRRLISPNFHV